MKMYQSMFDNIKFEADYWLPGVDPETGMRDGAVRTYGTWTGVHTETGKEFNLSSYHAMSFKDGKIIGGMIILILEDLWLHSKNNIVLIFKKIKSDQSFWSIFLCTKW